MVVCDTHDGSGYPAINAEFIARARTDVPALIAEVRRLRAALQDQGAADPTTIRGTP